MIESIVLTNFQKHRKLKVEFHEQVTTIAGKTGSGKTCLLRAIEFILLNRPRGDRFVRRNSKSGVATICLRCDGRNIKRRKGRGVNSYEIDGKKFKAFGVGKVPPDVHDTTKISPLNFQGQHDPVFWFTLTPGQVSKELNRIINLSQIDRTLDYAASEVRQAKSRLAVGKERLTEARKEVEELKWTNYLSADLAELEAKQSDLATIAIKRSQLNDLYETGLDATQRVDLASKAIVYASRAVSKGQKYRAARDRATQLHGIIIKLRSFDKLVRFAVPNMDILLRIRKDADNAAEDRRNLEAMLEELKTLTKECQCQQQRLTKKKQKLKRLTKSGKCPICNQPLKGRKVLNQKMSV